MKNGWRGPPSQFIATSRWPDQAPFYYPRRTDGFAFHPDNADKSIRWRGARLPLVVTVNDGLNGGWRVAGFAAFPFYRLAKVMGPEF